MPTAPTAPTEAGPTESGPFNPLAAPVEVRGKVPAGTYTFLAHDVVKAVSQSGNAYHTIDVEIVYPESVPDPKQNGVSVRVVETKGRIQLFYTAGMWAQTRANLLTIGVQLPNQEFPSLNAFADYVFPQVQALLKGKKFLATARSEERFATHPLTTQEYAEGKKQGALVLGPDNKPVVTSYNLRVDNIVSAPKDANSPY